MKNLLAQLNQSGLGKAIFVATFFAALYWIVFRFVPKYEIAIVGAIYELLWLPVLFVLFVLPLISFLLWAGEKFKVSSVHLWSLVLALLAVFGGYFLSQFGYSY